MKIKDLSFYTEITVENTNSINGGIASFLDPVGYANEVSQLVFSGASQNEINSFFLESYMDNTIAINDLIANPPTIEPTVFPGSGFV
jgi:hypothetical protein